MELIGTHVVHNESPCFIYSHLIIVRDNRDIVNKSLPFRISFFRGEATSFLLCGDKGSVQYDNYLNAIWQSDISCDRIKQCGSYFVTISHLKRNVSLLDSLGKLVNSISLEWDKVMDATYDSNNNLIIVTGFLQKTVDSYLMHNHPVQIPIVCGFKLNGEMVWKAYGFDVAQVRSQNLFADGRGILVEMGQNGFLYVAGESAGGDTVWGRKSSDIETPLPLNTHGKYQSVFNTGSNHISFIGKMDPESGETLIGTCLLSRNKDSSGNTFRPQFLRIDKKGNVFLAARSWYSFPSTWFAPGFLQHGKGVVLCKLNPFLDRTYSARLLHGPSTSLVIKDHYLFCCGTNWVSKFDILKKPHHLHTDEYRVHEVIKTRKHWFDFWQDVSVA